MFTFFHTDEDSNSSVRITNGSEAPTWMDLTEDFFAFLQGCGYALDRQEFADHVNDAFGQDELYASEEDLRKLFPESYDYGYEDDLYDDHDYRYQIDPRAPIAGADQAYGARAFDQMSSHLQSGQTTLSPRKYKVTIKE